jgi:Leucine-rich repeat (LRR) protein
MEIKEVPTEIGLLTELRKLFLSYNGITSLPSLDQELYI